MAVPNMRIFTVAAHAYMAQAWESVYTAGQTDTAGNYMGGSELLHFESHGGSLFTAIGYWEDSRNCLYPSANYLTCGGSPWGQILRLDEPGGQWVQDLHMDSWFVRAEALKSLAFSTDASGTALSGGPVRLLVAGAGVGGSSPASSSWIRDDSTMAWTQQNLLAGQECRRSVRAFTVHRDSETGVDSAFVTVGTCGVVRGSLTANMKSITFESAAEPGTNWEVRGLAFAEADGVLFVSAGEEIYRRNDGANPSWTRVFETGAAKSSGALGGIRGMTAIDNPSGSGHSLLFMWAVVEGNRGCMIRLDQDGSGGFTRTEETCLADQISTYLGGVTVYMTIGAYNDALEVESNGSSVHLIGFQAHIDCANYPCTQFELEVAGAPAEAGFYSGGIFFIRRAAGEYELNEVGGPILSNEPPRVAVRAYGASPFQSEAGQIYFGGHDCNEVTTTDTAWAMRGTVAEVLTPLSPRDPSPRNTPSPTPTGGKTTAGPSPSPSPGPSPSPTPGPAGGKPSPSPTPTPSPAASNFSTADISGSTPQWAGAAASVMLASLLSF